MDWLITKKRELATGALDELGVIVSAARQPSEDEWAEHLEQVVRLSHARLVRALVIVAPMGGPSGSQRAVARRRVSEMRIAELRRLLLLSESAIARLAANAIGTFTFFSKRNLAVRALPDRKRDEGLQGLAEAARFDAAALERAIKELKRDFMPDAF